MMSGTEKKEKRRHASFVFLLNPDNPLGGCSAYASADGRFAVIFGACASSMARPWTPSKHQNCLANRLVIISRPNGLSGLNGDAVVHSIPHNIYVALTRGEAQAPGLAGQTLRVADWYVRLVDDEPAEVVNETYGTIALDAAGRCAACAVGDARWLPTDEERAAMHALIFPGARRE